MFTLLGLLSQVITSLCLYGLLKLSWIIIPNAYRTIRSLAALQFNKPIDLQQYGEWAAITGCTAGIGKAYALELAKRGLNIVLISRNEDKLRITAQEIENEYAVKTYYIQADFKDRMCYSHIKKQMEGKDIGVLVNNVGVLMTIPRDYSEIYEDKIWESIEVNCGAVSMMTRMVLPQMKSKRKGLIVNISSLSSFIGFPFLGTYAATKSFIKMFSISLQEENRGCNIKIQCLIPGLVKTNMSKLLQKNTSIIDLFFPDAKTYAKSAVNSLKEEAVVTTGYWPHSLLELIAKLAPVDVRVKWISYKITAVMRDYENKTRHQTKKII